jgi:hypothetical protein
MWEISIVFSNHNKAYMESLKKMLLKTFKSSKFICTSVEEDDNSKLLIACENNQKLKLTKILDEAISELFVSEYKEEYLKNNLNLHNIDEVNLKAFIKALVCFDKDYDKEYCIKKLYLWFFLLFLGF